MLSIPPQATMFPLGAKTAVITQADLNKNHEIVYHLISSHCIYLSGIICVLLPVKQSHTISFPSREPLTACLERLVQMNGYFSFILPFASHNLLVGHLIIPAVTTKVDTSNFINVPFQ